MNYKFEHLEVWKLSLDLIDVVYSITSALPDTEKYNLTSQMNRAAISISLNIAEGSTSQTDAEQNKFIGYSLRSLVEVIACIRIIQRRKYITDLPLVEDFEIKAGKLFIKLQAFKNYLKK